jgi:hypothetical protein
MDIYFFLFQTGLRLIQINMHDDITLPIPRKLMNLKVILHYC